METALTVPQAITPTLLDGDNFDKLVRVIKMMFDDTRNQVTTKQALRLAATAIEEPGMGIMEGVNGGIHMIEGKPSLSARSLAKKIRLFGHDYEIIEHTAERCEIVGTRGDNKRKHTEIYTMEDANTAGLVKDKSGWQKHPRNMLFAFCIRNLVTFHFPECRGSAYLPGEVETDMVSQENEQPPKNVTPSAAAEVTTEVTTEDKMEGGEVIDAELTQEDQDKLLAEQIAKAAVEEEEDTQSPGAQTGKSNLENGFLAKIKAMRVDRMQDFFDEYKKELSGEKEWYDSCRESFTKKWARYTKRGRLGIYPLAKEQAQEKTNKEAKAQASDDWDNEGEKEFTPSETFFKDIKALIDKDNGTPRGFHVGLPWVKNFVGEVAERKKQTVEKFVRGIIDADRTNEFYVWMLDSLEKMNTEADGKGE